MVVPGLQGLLEIQRGDGTLNCPDCQQPVGADQFALGPWKDELDDKGWPLRCIRNLVIECDFCGLFRVQEDQDHRVIMVRGPTIRGRDALRIKQLIALANRTRRIPA